MTYFAILIPPVVGAIIGYCTNYLAIKMLFRPHKAVYFFGVRVPFTPGLVPKEQARLAKKLAEAITGRIITPEVLAEEIKKATQKKLPQLDEQGPELVKKLINEHVGKFAGMFLDADKIYAGIKEGLLEATDKEAHPTDTFEKMAAHAVEHIDIKAIIENRINEFDPQEAEELILSVIRRELQIIIALGGLLGFIIGWVPVLLVN